MGDTAADSEKILALKYAIHAIVSIRGSVANSRTILYQVTIDPTKISPERDHIRFGEVNADEFTGWVPVCDVKIHEVLGEFDPDEIVPYYTNKSA